MDQSNVTQPDLNVRITALQFASSAAAASVKDPACIMQMTRQFYLFMTGRDPLVDVGIQSGDRYSSMTTAEEFFREFELDRERHEPRVIYLEDYRSQHESDDDDEPDYA